MSKTKYTPDRTWKNVRIASNAKTNMKPVLSCKACPEGVSPEKNYGFFWVLIHYLICFLLFCVLRNPIRSFVNVIVPEEWNHAIAAFLSFGLEVSCCLVPVPISVLLSFYYKKWVPAEKPEVSAEEGSLKQSRCKSEAEGVQSAMMWQVVQIINAIAFCILIVLTPFGVYEFFNGPEDTKKLLMKYNSPLSYNQLLIIWFTCVALFLITRLLIKKHNGLQSKGTLGRASALPGKVQRKYNAIAFRSFSWISKRGAPLLAV